jgi:CRISPR-associated endonuclease Csn1
MAQMRYRLALDLGSTSLGWAMVRLDARNAPCAVIKAGVRLFSDGRNPKDGTSLAVTRRDARAMRRRRDRLLKRKARMQRALIELGFFPAEEAQRKALESLNPYTLRAKGLNEALTPAEFARALFHINQRRGFKSNRRTDKVESDAGALKQAISGLRQALVKDGCRTIGEWLERRRLAGETQRARYRERREITNTGKNKVVKSYDLYIDRAMIEQEFDVLWSKQAELNPAQFLDTARTRLKDVLLFQRKLRPVKPGRCTLIPTLPRAPLALPSSQRARIYQELNHLRVLSASLGEQMLTLQQRDTLAAALDKHSKRSFTQIKKLLGLSGAVQFNFEDPKREELKGNTTNAILGDSKHFGATWFEFSAAQQDAIVQRLIADESEAELIAWLQAETGIDEPRAERIANAGLPDGYGSLSAEALARLLPALRAEVITYDKAVLAAGFEHHSQFSAAASGEILPALPYYGEALQRHVGFGTGAPEDSPERRYGRIANPTVHIGLNQTRLVVNALIQRYGHPSEVIVEVARELKQSQAQRKEENQRQAERQTRNQKYRAEIANHLGISEEHVKTGDLQKLQLWEELNLKNAADRRCPYSGVQIGFAMLFSSEVEIDHVLPFSMTLDDSLNNKTVALRQANRIKGNRTPWQAFGEQAQVGFDYAAILQRAEAVPQGKRYRFAPDGYQQWLRDGDGFLARALTDTRYLSRVAREYLSLICPHGTRVIPGQMTAKLRGKFGLNSVLGLNGEKNRNDHRHHAVDACVVAVTDQGMLQRFAQASASARERQLDRLVEEMPEPWESKGLTGGTYREHVKRAVDRIWVSHKPDHGFEGAMHNDTAYALLGEGRVGVHKTIDGVRTYEEKPLKVIPFTSAKAHARHGLLADGSLRPYKGYLGGSIYCMEIVRNEKGRWESEIISTFQAYQIVKTSGPQRLRHSSLSMSGKPLVMRLLGGDALRLIVDDRLRTMRVVKMTSNGQIFMCELNEANVDARNTNKSDPFAYTSKYAGSLQKAQGRRVTISPIGEVRDLGFRP